MKLRVMFHVCLKCVFGPCDIAFKTEYASQENIPWNKISLKTIINFITGMCHSNNTYSLIVSNYQVYELAVLHQGQTSIGESEIPQNIPEINKSLIDRQMTVFLASVTCYYPKYKLQSIENACSFSHTRELTQLLVTQCERNVSPFVLCFGQKFVYYDCSKSLPEVVLSLCSECPISSNSHPVYGDGFRGLEKRTTANHACRHCLNLLGSHGR